MLKLKSFAVAGDTTFITATCRDQGCEHVFAKDAKGWHEKQTEPWLGKHYWEPILDFLTGDLEKLLEKAEAKYLKEKR